MAGASMKDIKLRIKSVQSTRQITKAMELVASSKLRKAKERVERARPFFEILGDTLDRIAANSRDFASVYTKPREVKKACFVVIAGDRGLAGGYNSNVLKAVEAQAGDTPYCVLPIGKKTMEYFTRRNAEILSDAFLLAADISIADCDRIGHMLADGFANGDFDALYIVYTKFVSMLSQVPQLEQMLPILPKESEGKSRELMICEPSPEAAFASIVPQYITGMVYGGVAEAQASESAARRTAMESATKNAGEMIDSLSLEYNRARQAAITQEITEIVSGSGV
ncbi:MAG: ATP synthase F1 subunit gamma [Clostridia bacterium]|nr:ATP synthase F1 subunit gamma [Clostridia bacterium]